MKFHGFPQHGRDGTFTPKKMFNVVMRHSASRFMSRKAFSTTTYPAPEGPPKTSQVVARFRAARAYSPRHNAAVPPRWRIPVRRVASSVVLRRALAVFRG